LSFRFSVIFWFVKTLGLAAKNIDFEKYEKLSLTPQIFYVFTCILKNASFPERN
jgi:hypothetical protein